MVTWINSPLLNYLSDNLRSPGPRHPRYEDVLEVLPEVAVVADGVGEVAEVVAAQAADPALVVELGKKTNSSYILKEKAIKNFHSMDLSPT